MKSFVALSLLALAADAGLAAAHVHHHAGMGHAQALRARNTAYWADRRANAKRRLPAHQASLTRRKALGYGDATTLPDNAAPGSDSTSCTCWHQVSAGEVCLGLIDKSSSGFTLDKFFSLNPSLNSDCSNLQVGTSYCVDDGANTGTATPADGSASVASATGLKLAHDDDDEECDSNDPDCVADDEDDDDVSSASAVPTSTKPLKTPVAAAVKPTSATPNTWTQSSNTWTPTSSSKWTQPTTTSASSGSSGAGVSASLTEGTVTFYYQNGVAGACGTVSPDSSKVAALYTSLYAGGANCGRQIQITNTDTSASVTVTVMDECPSCTDESHIDLSTGAYDVLGAQSAGVLNVKWEFIS